MRAGHTAVSPLLPAPDGLKLGRTGLQPACRELLADSPLTTLGSPPWEVGLPPVEQRRKAGSVGSDHTKSDDAAVTRTAEGQVRTRRPRRRHTSYIGNQMLGKSVVRERVS